MPYGVRVQVISTIKKKERYQLKHQNVYDFFPFPIRVFYEANEVEQTQVKYVDLSKYKIMVTANPEIKER